MRIGPRLLTNAVLIATFSVVTTILLIGTMSYNYGRKILEDDAKDRLVLVRDMKTKEINQYFDSIKKQALLFSNDKMVIDAMVQLDHAFNTYAAQVSVKGLDKYKDEVIKHYIEEFSQDYANNNGGIPFDATPYLNTTNQSTFALQYNYIFNNPYGIDKEEKLSYVDDGSDYSKIHSQFHDRLRELKTLFDMEDIFFVDPNNGDIIYTVAKGLDFTTSLINGPYAETALGEVFRAVNTDDGRRSVVFSDFAPYTPSNDDQASFVATQIFDNGKKVGILIFQLNDVNVNEIMTSGNGWQEIGLGKTGETYIVDAQHRMLTNSRFYVENPSAFLQMLSKQGADVKDITRIKAKKNNWGLVKIDTMGVDEALKGQTGFGIYKDYRGVEVLGAYEPLQIGGLKLALIAEMDKTEAFAAIHQLAKKMIINLIGVMFLIILFATIVGIGLAKQISVPIEKLNAAIRILAKSQDLTRRIDYNAKDEIGEMAVALNTLLDSCQKTIQETILSTQKVQTTAHRLLNLADEIDSQESMHKFEDNYDSVHEKTSEIKDAGDSLSELSERLQVLSRQFKVFEEESDRASGW